MYRDPIFGAEMRETLNDGRLENTFDEMLSMFSAITFFFLDIRANLNGFAARLTAPSVLNLETYAILVPRHTPEEVQDTAVDSNLVAGTRCIAYVGMYLCHNAAKEY